MDWTPTMRTCTKCGETKPLDQFRKRSTGKPFSTCLGCDKLRASEWQRRNKDKNRAAVGRYVSANRERIRERQRARYAVLKAEGLLPTGTPPKLRQKAAKYSTDWRRRNPGKCRAFENNRKAAKLQRTPPWADMEKIAAVYDEAAALRALGIDVHVDHEIPLRGELVSGLHVHANLRVILAEDNRTKGNKFQVG